MDIVALPFSCEDTLAAMLNYAPRLIYALIVVLVCVGSTGLWASAERSATATFLEGTSAAPGDVQFFDIPAQPLAAALKQYANRTRMPTLVRGELVYGLRSSAVRGNFGAEEALRLLLKDTTLVVEKIPDDLLGGFILKPAPMPSASYVANWNDLPVYTGMIQSRVWQALCDTPRAAPGKYRLLLRFRVDATGQLHRIELLGSTADKRRDSALVTALQAVRFDRPPPDDLPQPLTLLIEPHDVDGGPECDRARALR